MPKPIRRLPEAVLVFDKFHVVQKLLQAVDQVRRDEANELRKTNPELLKKTRYIWLKNPENLTDKQRARLGHLERLNLSGFPRRWKDCLERLVHFAKGDRTQYYYRYVGAYLTNGKERLLLDVQAQRPGEGEMACALRLLARVLERYPRLVRQNNPPCPCAALRSRQKTAPKHRANLPYLFHKPKNQQSLPLRHQVTELLCPSPTP